MLSSKGLKSQLTARLSKVLKTEQEKEEEENAAKKNSGQNGSKSEKEEKDEERKKQEVCKFYVYIGSYSLHHMRQVGAFLLLVFDLAVFPPQYQK